MLTDMLITESPYSLHTEELGDHGNHNNSWALINTACASTAVVLSLPKSVTL